MTTVITMSQRESTNVPTTTPNTKLHEELSS